MPWRKEIRAEKERALYARKRAALIVEMGGACWVEGSKHEGPLEFHHLEGNLEGDESRGWNERQVNRLQRVRLYRRDWEAGRLELRCRYHHRLGDSSLPGRAPAGARRIRQPGED